MSVPTYSELENRQALQEHLRDLYPHLPQRDMKIKLAAAVESGLFGFFRAYVPYFYDLLRRKRSDPEFPDFHGMDVIEGWCVGDAHPENFGVIHCRSAGRENDMVFTMNDPDDGCPGPLFADVLRFLTAVRLFDQAMSLEPIVNAYRQGLDGDEGFSPVVIREIKRARKGRDHPERLFRLGANDVLKPRRKIRKRFRFQKKVPPEVARRLKKGVRGLVGKTYGVCAIWSLKKRGGGSGGLRRYWVLLAPRGRQGVCTKAYDKRALVLDLKTLAKPGMHSLQCPRENPPRSMACSDASEMVMNRVWETLDLERGVNVSRFCDVVKFDKLPPMLVRARWNGNRGVELDSARYSRRELAQLLKDEAKVLGHIHSKSLPGGSHYSGHVYVLAPVLVEASRQMEGLYRRAFCLVE